jgi:hypothetical protein
MRAFCFTCQAETIVGSSGACGFCDTRIVEKHQRSRAEHLGGHSYIGDEAFYEKCHARYLELRSLRGVAREVYAEAGYASVASCANTLHEIFVARGWPTYQREYAMTTHGKLLRERRDPEYRRAQRVKRGEIRDVRCAGVTRAGAACSRPAMRGAEHCHVHAPERRGMVVDQMARMRARKGA